MPAEPERPISVPEIVARVYKQDLSLQLRSEDLAMLAGIHTALQGGGTTTLDEDGLRAIFELVDEVAHGERSTVRQRSTTAVARLREQRLLARVDAAGVVRSGEYTLTQLGKSVVEFFTRAEDLSRESLQILMARIRADLAQILQEARRGGGDEHWRTRVEAPLRLTVPDLIEGIDRRQRGMDLQQQAIRDEISGLLEANWFHAIERCEALLETTGQTLQELHQTLMEEVEAARDLLHQQRQQADEAGRETTLAALESVDLQLEHIRAWGESRVRVWSEYYQNVHGFIRSVVRVDRDRAISARLTEALKRFPEQPWTCLVTEQAPYHHLRECELRGPPVRVERPKQVHRVQEELRETSSLEADLESLVTRTLESAGRARLVELILRVFPHLSADERYQAAGLLVQKLARAGLAAPLRERHWQPLEGGIEVQDLTVVRRPHQTPHDPKGHSRAGRREKLEAKDGDA